MDTRDFGKLALFVVPNMMGPDRWILAVTDEQLKKIQQSRGQWHGRRGAWPMDTTNLSPDTPVSVGGMYYCCLCKHADPMLKNALSGYAKEKGVDPDAVFAAMGMGADQPITRKRFVMGDKFGVCPRHQKATG